MNLCPTEEIEAACAEQAVPKVLIIDDEPLMRLSMMDALKAEGYDVQDASTGDEGITQVRARQYDLVITDLRMPGSDGLQVVQACKDSSQDTEVIVITAHGSVETAVQAMKLGAYHYIAKPYKIDSVRNLVSEALMKRRLQLENRELRERLASPGGVPYLIGQSPAMNRVHKRIRQIAVSDANILLLGESGTGKELSARAIHDLSARSKNRFVAFNCGSFTEDLMANELFGHEKGAYTGATRRKPGLIETADKGTVFLDEVGDMPMATQIKLLRVLENGEITRVGSNEPVMVNVRILSATNQDLEESIDRGTFRQDLYHRLKVITITLPSLIDRHDDIPLLAEHFVRQMAKRHSKTIKNMATAVRRRLLNYDWPGNVRQLRNVVESMVVVDYDGVLDVDDLPAELIEQGEVPPDPSAGGLTTLVGRPLSEIERLFIAETLKITAGNREEAAGMLGIGERTLYRKIKEFKL